MNALLVKGPVGFERESGRVSLLNVTAHLDPSFGGISAVVPTLCSAVSAASRTHVSIAAFCNIRETMPAIAGVDVHRYTLGPVRWVIDSPMRGRFTDQIRAADGIHIHGLWREHSTVAAWHSRAWKKPYLISAHGMLERWALANKRLKKAVFSTLIERRNLSYATCLHALTAAELGDYRRLGLKTPVAIVPNGISLPAYASSELFFNRYPLLRNRRIVLFLGRIHYKKGVDLLCRAWATIYRRWQDAHLVIAGPDFENTQSGIKALIRDLGLQSSVTFTGMLHAELKWSALRAAQLFVLPSHSEGFSVSVLEAMGTGLPVVVTDKCNIPEVRRYNCGLVIQPNIGELTEALSHLLSINQTDLDQLGREGKQLVKQRYSWGTVAKQMAELYEWMLGGRLPVGVEVYSS